MATFNTPKHSPNNGVSADSAAPALEDSTLELLEISDRCINDLSNWLEPRLADLEKRFSHFTTCQSVKSAGKSSR